MPSPSQRLLRPKPDRVLHTRSHLVAHTSDRLASVELLTYLILATSEMACQVAFHKRRLHRAGAEAVQRIPCVTKKSIAIERVSARTAPLLAL